MADGGATSTNRKRRLDYSPSASSDHTGKSIPSCGPGSQRLKPSQAPTMEDRKVEMEEKLAMMTQKKIFLERELSDMKTPPPPLAVLPLPGLKPIEATCRTCHHCGHKESGNRNRQECCYEPCPGFMYCGIKDKHKNHMESEWQKEKEIKLVKDKVRETEAEIQNVKLFITKNQTQFTRVVKPHLHKFYPEKYAGLQGRSKLMKDVCLLKVALDGKLPSPDLNDAVEFLRLLAKGKEKTSEYSTKLSPEEYEEISPSVVNKVRETLPIQSVVSSNLSRKDFTTNNLSNFGSGAPRSPLAPPPLPMSPFIP
ncbi:uncharacterized protein LOC144444633 [Glandiceps talaboti]